MKSLGQKIREERRRLDLTLDQVARSTGLSKSFLSQIERNAAQPSISTIKKIAHEFGISVVKLFMNEAEENNNPLGHPPLTNGIFAQNRSFVQDIKVVRANQRKRFILPHSSMSYDLITPDLNRLIEMLYLRLSPGDNSGTEPVIDPEGEKCCMVLKGTLELTVKGQLFELREGDSLYYPANVPHSWRGGGTVPTEAIVVIVPPWF